MNFFSLEVLDGESLFGSPEYHPGQVRFSGDDQLVGIAIVTGAYYLGIVYCSNRPGKK